MKTVPIEELKANFCYTPTTGVVIHKVKKYNGALAMQPAGSATRSGHLQTKHNGTCLQNHRIAWALFYGRWPEGEIDHIDRNPQNNRIDNLREATRPENNRNSKKRSDNTSGIRGVYWSKEYGKWVACISTGGRRRFLGRFANKDDAHIVRLIAENCLWGGIHQFEEEKNGK